MEAKGILGPFPHALEIWKVDVAIVVKNKRTPNKENIAEQQLPGLQSYHLGTVKAEVK